jgi:hypothetical protein
MSAIRFINGLAPAAGGGLLATACHLWTSVSIQLAAESWMARATSELITKNWSNK